MTTIPEESRTSGGLLALIDTESAIHATRALCGTTQHMYGAITRTLGFLLLSVAMLVIVAAGDLGSTLLWVQHYENDIHHAFLHNPVLAWIAGDNPAGVAMAVQFAIAAFTLLPSIAQIVFLRGVEFSKLFAFFVRISIVFDFVTDCPGVDTLLGGFPGEWGWAWIQHGFVVITATLFVSLIAQVLLCASVVGFFLSFGQIGIFWVRQSRGAA